MKSVLKSKLNWLGVILTLLGILTDPQFQGYLADFISTPVLSKIISGSGILVVFLRTFATSQPVSFNPTGKLED